MRLIKKISLRIMSKRSRIFFFKESYHCHFRILLSSLSFRSPPIRNNIKFLVWIVSCVVVHDDKRKVVVVVIVIVVSESSLLSQP